MSEREMNMEEYIRRMDEKALWDAIQNACLNQNQTSFTFTLYQYTKGFMGRPAKTSLKDGDPKKITDFLKAFCEKYQINGTFYDGASAQEPYTHTASVKLELPEMTVRNIKNAKLFQDREKENILRKKVLPYYGPMSNSQLAQKLKPLVVKDFQNLSISKKQNLSIRHDYISIRCLIAQNQIQIDPDYKTCCYRQYRYADFGGHSFDAVEMSAMALVLLDAVFLQLEQDYSKQLTTKGIRILNIGVEISLRIEGFL